MSIYDAVWDAVTAKSDGKVTVRGFKNLLDELEGFIDPLNTTSRPEHVFSNDPLILGKLATNSEKMGGSKILAKEEAFNILEQLLSDIQIVKTEGDTHPTFTILTADEVEKHIEINEFEPSSRGKDIRQKTNFSYDSNQIDLNKNLPVLQISPNSIRSEDDDLDIDDYDETASLMETSPTHKRYRSSPSIMDVDEEIINEILIKNGPNIDSDPLSDLKDELDPLDDSSDDNSVKYIEDVLTSDEENDIKVQSFHIRKSLDDLQKFHNSLDSKFEYCASEIRQLKKQNSEDFENLVTLSASNERIIERIGSIKSDLKEIEVQLHQYKRNLKESAPSTPSTSVPSTPHRITPARITPSKIPVKTSATRHLSLLGTPSPRSIDVTRTTMNEHDIRLIEKLRHKSFPLSDKSVSGSLYRDITNPNIQLHGGFRAVPRTLSDQNRHHRRKVSVNDRIALEAGESSVKHFYSLDNLLSSGSVKSATGINSHLESQPKQRHSLPTSNDNAITVSTVHSSIENDQMEQSLRVTSLDENEEHLTTKSNSSSKARDTTTNIETEVVTATTTTNDSPTDLPGGFANKNNSNSSTKTKASNESANLSLTLFILIFSLLLLILSFLY
ncbi:uncharacterized protein RJT20DRAFT_135194 [Scheffersomyces xylosifermentans]|uniref:uncharacterized protein n=1 Tax=Scheffersomyces xylosifermentans TaxID=1304137 RepID=UPI00315C5E46